jgi:hypothetical protein
MFKVLMLIGMIFINSIFAAATIPNEPDSYDSLVQKIKRIEITIAYSEELEQLSIRAVRATDEARMELDTIFGKKYGEMVEMVNKEKGKPLFPLYSIKTNFEALTTSGNFEDIIPKFIILRDSLKERFTRLLELY